MPGGELQRRPAMNDKLTPARKLRLLLDEPGIIRSMGAHDVLTALLIERAGFI